MQLECKIHGVQHHILTRDRGRERRLCSKCSYGRVKQNRIKLKERAVAYKGGACQDCGYDRYQEVLEFHHRDPLAKDFQIGSMHGWERIKSELDKCDMLCANCHRETHVRLKRDDLV